MQIVSADLIVADLATELELNFQEANQCFESICEEGDDSMSSIEFDY
jgi:hypothetical protein